MCYWVSSITGQDRFTIMTRVYYQQAHACILIFDVTQPSSFRNLFKWKKNLDENCHLKDGSVVPSMVLANKVLNCLIIFI